MYNIDYIVKDMNTQDKNAKSYSKRKGRCPICGANLETSKEELFEQLGLPTESRTTATEQDIKKAFREKVKTAHPDKGGDPEEFAELNEAKERLIDIVKEDDTTSNDEVEEVKPKILTKEQFVEVVKAIQNLKRARAAAPLSPCPYCKRRPKAQ